MTWTAVGAIRGTAQLSGVTSGPLPLVNQGIGNVVVVISVVEGSGITTTGISGGGATWAQLGSALTGVTSTPYSVSFWAGTVTATGAQTATVSYSGTSGVNSFADGWEFSFTAPSWSFDTSGILDSTGTVNTPALTSLSAGELYVFYALDNASGTAGTNGTPPGYVYTIDSFGNDFCYNLTFTSGTGGTFGTPTAAFIGGAVLLREAPPAPQTPPVPLPPRPPWWFPGSDCVATEPDGIPFLVQPAPADPVTPPAPPVPYLPWPPVPLPQLPPGWFPGADTDVAQGAASVVSTSASTATLFASGTPTTAQSGTGSWANPANSSGANDGVFAVFTSTTSGETGTINPTGFGAQAAIGAQPTSVDSVAVTVWNFVAQVARWTSVTVQLFDGSTPLGSSQSLTLSATSTNSQTVTFTGVATWANLANLTVQVVATKAVTTSSTFSLDAVGVVVNFTSATYTFSGGGQPGVADPGGIPFYVQPQPTDATPGVPVPPPPPGWPVPAIPPNWFPGSQNVTVDPGGIPFYPQPVPLLAALPPPPPPFIAGLAGSGINGYFVDQYGNPKFLQIEMIWGLPCNAGRWNGSGGGTWQQDIDSYFNARGSQGAVSAWWGVPWINTTIDSAAVFADGRTWDGVFPFSLNGTPGTIATGTETVTLNDPFWQRIDRMLVASRRNGIAIFLNLGMVYDFTDTGAIFVHLSSTQAHAIGAAVATRYPQASYPNLHWAFGDDTQSGAGAAITCETAFTQMLAGIKSTGDTRPIITMEQMLETDSHIEFSDGAAYVPGGFGITSATINFCYSYFPWYIAIEESYTETTGPPLPVVMGDGPWYGDSQSGAVDYTIRRFAWWALASGCRGLDTTSGPSLAGATSLWKWTASAVGNLTSDPNGSWVTSVLHNVLAYYTSLPGWYKLIPDTGNVLVTAGRGSRTANPPAPSFDTPNYGDTDNYVAASRVADGSLAVIYSNSHFTITINQGAMAPGYTATWVDPLSLATQAATPGTTFSSTPLGNNSAGNPDWVLVLQGTPSAPVLLQPGLPAAAILPPGWFPGSDAAAGEPGGIPFWPQPLPADPVAIPLPPPPPAVLIPQAVHAWRRPTRLPARGSFAWPNPGGVSQPPVPPQAIRDVRREPRIPPRGSTAAWTQGISQPPVPPEAVRDTRRPVRVPPRGSTATGGGGVSQPPVPPEAVRDTRRPVRVPPRGSTARGAGGIAQPAQPPLPPQAVRDTRRPWWRKGSSAGPVAPQVPPAPFAPGARQSRLRPARFPLHQAASPPAAGFTPPAAARQPQPLARLFRPPFLPRWQREATPVPPQAAAVQAQAVPQAPRPQRHLVTRRAVSVTPQTIPVLPPVIARPVRRVFPRRGQAASWTQGVAQPPLPPQPPVLAAPHRIRAFTRWQRVTQHVPPQVVIAPPPPALPPAGARRWPLRTRRAVTASPGWPPPPLPPPALPPAGARRWPLRTRKAVPAFPVPPQVVIPPAVPAPRAPRRPWTFRLPWWMRRSVIIFPNVPPPAVRKATAVSKVTEAATTPAATGEQATTTTRVTNPDQGSSSVS